MGDAEAVNSVCGAACSRSRGRDSIAGEARNGQSALLPVSCCAPAALGSAFDAFAEALCGRSGPQLDFRSPLRAFAISGQGSISTGRRARNLFIPPRHTMATVGTSLARARTIVPFQASRRAAAVAAGPPGAAAAAAGSRLRVQRRRGASIVAQAELEEVDPMTGEIISGSAMAAEAGWVGRAALLCQAPLCLHRSGSTPQRIPACSYCRSCLPCCCYTRL